MILTYLTQGKYSDHDLADSKVNFVEVDFQSFEKLKNQIQQTEKVQHVEEDGENKFQNWAPPLWEQIYQQGSKTVRIA